jgi:Fur family peroxide stress response transcriptional regulator
MKTDEKSRYDQILSKIRKRGGRLTSHRLALLRLLASSEGHPTALQLYDKLKDQFPTMSLATIYKTLAILKEENEVLEIDLHGESRYDGNKPFSHPHLICTQCCQIFDGDDLPILEGIQQQIYEKYHFQVQHQQQIFYGLCTKCQSELTKLA